MGQITTRGAELLWRLYCHRTDDYALQRADGTYLRAGQVLSLETLQRHVAGTETVGVYQVRGTSVRWICLDVDSASGDAESCREAVQALLLTARHFGLEPTVERSGGKGWHLWLFTEELDAALARAVAGGILAETGEAPLVGVKQVEVFPKQSGVNESAPFGNLVKLPFGKRADNGQRGILVDPESLSPLRPDAQVVLLEQARVHAAADLAELVAENGWQEPRTVLRPAARHTATFQQAPTEALPCWGHILEVGIEEGYRDNVVYSLAKLARRQGMPATTALPILQMFDAGKVRPPLGPRIIEQKVASAYKGGPAIGCENVQAAGLCPAQNGAACPVYGRREEAAAQAAPPVRDGVGFSIEPLGIVKSDPPKYRATVNGTELELSLLELAEFKRFKVVCIARLQFVPVLPVRRNSEGKKLPDQLVWEREVLNPALQSVDHYEEAPEDAGLAGATWENVLLFLRESRHSEERDEVYDDRLVIFDNQYAFRGRVLRNWLSRNKLRTVEEHELWAIVRKHGANPSIVRTVKGNVRVWLIPTSAAETR